MRKKIKEIFKKPPKLNHLRLLTTKSGILQHSIGSVPDPDMGYSIDDNARALIAVLEYKRLYLDRAKARAKNKSLFDLAHSTALGNRSGSTFRGIEGLAKIYLDFIEKAQNKNYKFHNFKSFQGRFLDNEGSEDSFGRVVWALGYVVSGQKVDPHLKRQAKIILEKSLNEVLKLKYPRGLAFSLLGLFYLKDKTKTKILADKLVDLFLKNKNINWKWFESSLTYSNSILPLSLFLAYNLTKDKKYLKVATESFNFLLKTCEEDGIVSAIGQAGWYKKGSEKTLFDQQPVDPADMVICSVWAYKITKHEKYLKEAYGWFGWFYGRNITQKMMIDENTGAVFDGLTKDRVNINQGAESIICYLLAHTSLKDIEEL